jgi:hypothetical protein
MRANRPLLTILVLTLLLSPQRILPSPVVTADAYGPSDEAPSAMSTINVCDGGAQIVVACAPGSDISDEIQSAVDTLKPQGGGTIYLPSGDFQFTDTVEMPGGINIIGQGQGATILRSDGSAFFDINHYGGEGGALRITGISFYGLPAESGSRTHTGISIYNIAGFRIDHCYFERILYNIGVISREGYPQSRGVVDHCSFIAADLTSAYGVFDTRHGTDWSPESTKYKLGTAEATFIEDCHFEHNGHAAASFDGGHYVLRHSTIVDSGSIDAHGPGFGCCGRGARASEIYENNIYHTPGNRFWSAIGLRAGGGVIFDNTFTHFDHAVRFSIDTYGYNATGGVYPTLDQVTNMWIWDNTLVDVTYDPSDPDYEDDLSNVNRSIVSGVLLYSNEAGRLIRKDRDFFMRAPSPGEDGFTYEPYLYPHPLTRDLKLMGTPGNQTAYLNWTVCASLAPATSWHFAYYSTTLASALTATVPLSITRDHLLTGLENYVPYWTLANSEKWGTSLEKAAF